MFSIIVATHDSERALVPTLSALVPGATAGVVREVIIADGGSRDATQDVADYAGCHFISSSQPLGGRLKQGAASARGAWLMFLAAGAVPGPGWIEDVVAFVEETERRDAAKAAVFASGARDLRALARRAFGLLPVPAQGLILRRTFYEKLGEHSPAEDAETAILGRIGRPRIVTLSAAVTIIDI
jgi:glycosyltransferase involved in cell wall biosynthesis